MSDFEFASLSIRNPHFAIRISRMARLTRRSLANLSLGAKSRVVAGHVSNRSRRLIARHCFTVVTSTQIGTEFW
jgi:hypothetical protein